MSSLNPSVAAAATLAATRRSRSKRMFVAVGRGLVRVPLFLYILGIYLLISRWVPNVRDAFQVGPYAFTWVESLQIVTTLSALLELLRVSNPGDKRNTRKVHAMLVVAVIYLVIAVLAVANVEWAAHFDTSEFMMLALVVWIQTMLAYTLNARVLQRTIENTGLTDHEHEN